MIKSVLLGTLLLTASVSTASASENFCSKNLRVAKVAMNKLLNGMTPIVVERNIQRVMFESGCSYEIPKNIQGQSVAVIRKRSLAPETIVAETSTENEGKLN
jgi:hypothetical protein